MQAIVKETNAVAGSREAHSIAYHHADRIPSGFTVARTWRALSFLALIAIWVALEGYGIFSPGLLDDVDSVYIESAREMLVRHDFVTPYVDGIRFFDKPPLMYWLASAFMRLFGIHDWAARLPLALLSLALFFAVYSLGSRLFGARGGLYSALVTATSIGPYLFTRFFIPDVLLALWMTLAVHLFLKALSLLNEPLVDHSRLRVICWAFATVMAFNVLTKGLVGLVFPFGMVMTYLAVTHQLHLIRRLYLYSSTVVFLAIAAPWHLLVALRNPAVSGSVVARGWFWFYIVNEHFMRFLGKRIPRDYGQVPLLLFLVLAGLWLVPWASFLPMAASWSLRALGDDSSASVEARHTALILLLWAGMVLAFFCFSSRQEYYSLPALPALALLIGGFLARAEESNPVAERKVLAASRWLLLPLSLLIAAVTGYFAIAAPMPPTGADIASLLFSDPARYNLALGHIFDLTGRAMGLFRGPLTIVCVAMLVGGPLSHFFRMRRRHLFANLTLTVASVAVLLCVHEGLTRFYPILGSKSLALAINGVYQPGNRILIDGEYTLGSSLNFYTQQPVALVDGRMNGTWYGSYWPDAPKIFESNNSLHELWSSNSPRLFLLTCNGARAADLSHYGPVYRLASAGGKTVLTNRP
jgi:4-amino-4-deoxy-L-arabinose transferase-like glycosyltransferase